MQNWIDDINKKLEEQRNSYKESIESGEVELRKQFFKQSNAGKSGGTISQQNTTFEQRSNKSKKANDTLGIEGKIKRAKKANEVLTSEERTLRNKKGQDTCRKNLLELYIKILDTLPNEFSKQQYVDVLNSFDKEPSFIYYCNKTFPGYVELKRRGSPKSGNLEYYYVKS